jgi:hypothetical protein
METFTSNPLMTEIFDYTATQIKISLNGKIVGQTTFSPIDVVRHNVQGGVGVALDKVHYMIRYGTSSPNKEVFYL